MGKNVVLRNNTGPERAPYATPSMPRAHLVEIVDEALDETRRATSEDAVAIIAEPIRQIARTTDKIDANSWKCVNSCGCPLTAAGFAKRDAQVNFRSLFPDRELRNPADYFPGFFDGRVSNRLAISGPATITITD